MWGLALIVGFVNLLVLWVEHGPEFRTAPLHYFRSLYLRERTSCPHSVHPSVLARRYCGTMHQVRSVFLCPYVRFVIQDLTFGIFRIAPIPNATAIAQSSNPRSPSASKEIVRL